MVERTICVRTNDTFFRQVKLHLANTGETMQDFIIRVIKSDIADKTPQASLIFQAQEELKSVNKKLIDVHTLLQKFELDMSTPAK